MNPKALHKAHHRLTAAKNAIAEVESCTNYDEFCVQWSNFLHAAKGIYTVLEQGAKATPQSRQWFGKKNRERLTDPLLRYVCEARNDDEHGIEPVSRYVPPELKLGVGRQGYSNTVVDDRGNTFVNCGAALSFSGKIPDELPTLRALDGKPILNEFIPPHAKLVRVHDRSKTPYDPPTSHVGQPVPDSSPLAIGKLANEYLSKLLDEAQTLASPSRAAT